MLSLRRPATAVAVLLCSLLFHFTALADISRYNAIIAEVSRAAEAEVRAGAISGVTLALIDQEQIVFARGFGWADKKRRIPSTASTVYRAGSISKLFTAVSAMQLVEQGRMDLDKPVTTYLPDFRIIDPFDREALITLRQLMCHRSGMVREAPVGGYFDDSEPGMDGTVASLSRCVLLYRPGSRTRYSNSGVTMVGHAVEKTAGVAFPEYQHNFVLAPLGMTNSAWLRTPRMRNTLATGYLPVARPGGFREINAPVFDFGILAAGNLYTTAEDLGRFIICLFAEGRTSGTRLLRAETLAEMFTPQLTSETNAFGLGFSLGMFRGRRSVSHMGAVYGFTSSLMAIPSEKIGVVVLCNDDIATGPVRKLNALALGLMLGHKTGQAPPGPASSPALNAEALRSFSGDYESKSFWARVEVNGQQLAANISGQKLALTAAGTNRFVGGGRIAFEAPFTFQRDSNGVVTGFTAMNQSFQRVNTASLLPAPAAWKALQGTYGPEFIPLIVSVKHGHLYAMTENEFDNRLTPITETVFQMPPGLYTDEYLVFQTDRKGKAHTAVLGNMPLRRR